MKLFLIRHGETTDNVAQVYAGVKDSPLTIHGSLQAEKLAQYLASSGTRLTDIFSSDLQRAAKTAGSILKCQLKFFPNTKLSTVNELSVLREQDFGYYEGKPFYARPRGRKQTGKENHRAKYLHDPGFKDVETKESMALRMDSYIEEHIVPLLKSPTTAKEPVVAVVSHGMVLSSLWRCLLKRFDSGTIRLASGLAFADGTQTNFEYLGGWSNTGYLELDILGSSLANAIDMIDAIHGPPATEGTSAEVIKPTLLHGWNMVVRMVNGKEHLKGLKRTGGGVGSSKADDRQKKIETFFVSKKQKKS
ncbi:MAG: hypothetical protein MMC33_000020 [Icmadophila ericetorum]|nr:hypothetical protein [Icmadophila ericetorum]